MDWFSNNLESTLAILGIILSILFFYVGIKRNSKNLTFDIIASTPLIDSEMKIKGLSVRHNEEVLDDVQFLLIEIKNDGHETIKREDYESSINLIFGENPLSISDRVKIISAEIDEKQPKDLQVNYQVKNDIIEISPLLLNKGDFFRLKFLTSFCIYDNIEVNARISGIKNIERPKKILNDNFTFGGIAVVLILIVVTFIFDIHYGSDLIYYPVALLFFYLFLIIYKLRD